MSNINAGLLWSLKKLNKVNCSAVILHTGTANHFLVRKDNSLRWADK